MSIEGYPGTNKGAKYRIVGKTIEKVGCGARPTTHKTVYCVMLNLFQHLMKSVSYETLK